MNILFAVATALLFAVSGAVADPVHLPQACWLESSSAVMDATLGAQGLRDTTVWFSTVSSVLVRHPKGDVLIDTGFSPKAEAQMNELPDEGRAFGSNVVAASKGRKPIDEVLRSAGEPPARVARILITHAHYDHIGGATLLTAPVYVAPAELAWMNGQEVQPTITPPSLVKALRPRLREVAFAPRPFLGFDNSADIYGDGAIVVVPLPGHTPGSLGVFVKLGQRRAFFIGDATDTLEAAERGLPKSVPIRSHTDYEPELADDQATRIAEFHVAHPEVAIVPAHDRSAYTAIFGTPSTCRSGFAGN